MHKLIKKEQHTYLKHPHYTTFKPYSKQSLATALNLSVSYLSSVLYGHATPSIEVNARINTLAQEIITEGEQHE